MEVPDDIQIERRINKKLALIEKIIKHGLPEGVTRRSQLEKLTYEQLLTRFGNSDAALFEGYTTPTQDKLKKQAEEARKAIESACEDTLSLASAYDDYQSTVDMGGPQNNPMPSFELDGDPAESVSSDITLVPQQYILELLVQISNQILEIKSDLKQYTTQNTVPAKYNITFT